MCSRILEKGALLFGLLLNLMASDAQQKEIYHYQDLSQFAFAKTKDSLKKNWICPTLFTAKKTQKKYKELWDSRVEFITGAIDNNNFVQEKEIYSYINSIIDQIVSANPQYIPKAPVLFLDRSASVNAYAVGGNMIAVNMGLITFSRSREEIALVIAHELSHNILQHTDKAMKEHAEWVTSDEYEKSLNDVLSSKYEQYTRLKKVFENYSFSRSRHNRYHESDADSLAIVLLHNSKISFVAGNFLRLDSADQEYLLPLKKPLNEYFQQYGLSFEDSWMQKRSKGLSTKNYSFNNGNSGITDSMKTHPDCEVRYQKTLAQTDKDPVKTLIPPAIVDKANRILLWNMFDNKDLSACLYRIFLEKDKGKTDEWYDFMASNIISGLYFSDKTLSRFNAIGIMPKEYISKNYYELQTMLEQLPKETLDQYFKAMIALDFWQKLPSDARAMKTLLVQMNSAEQAVSKETTLAAKNFLTANNSSMYCEFASHFNN